MVWFQCDDCGEDLKKPKLAKHFNMCSASKLSCIDCGVVFSQYDVQAHTKCVSETEKYGPKNVPATANASNSKHTNSGGDSEGLNFSMGLSTAPPWKCSLCNVKATSHETLRIHSEGKKHKSKVKAITRNQAKLEDESKHELLELGTDVKTEKSQGGNGTCKPEEDSIINGDPKKGSVIAGIKARNGVGIDGKQGSHQEEKISTLNIAGSNSQGKGPSRDISPKKGSVLREISLINGLDPPKSKKQKDRKRKEDCNELGSPKQKKKAKSCEPGLQNGMAHGSSDIHQQFLTTNVWKKMIKKALKKSDEGILKKKALRKLVLPCAIEAVEATGAVVNKEALRMEFKNQLVDNPEFTIEGKVVQMAKHGPKE